MRCPSRRTTLTPVEPFTLRSQRLGCLPIVNFLLDRMGVAEKLQDYLPTEDPRLRLAQQP